jgi:hypothetical protein
MLWKSFALMVLLEGTLFGWKEVLGTENKNVELFIVFLPSISECISVNIFMYMHYTHIMYLLNKLECWQKNIWHQVIPIWNECTLKNKVERKCPWSWWVSPSVFQTKPSIWNGSHDFCMVLIWGWYIWYFVCMAEYIFYCTGFIYITSYITIYILLSLELGRNDKKYQNTCADIIFLSGGNPYTLKFI